MLHLLVSLFFCDFSKNLQLDRGQKKRKIEKRETKKINEQRRGFLGAIPFFGRAAQEHVDALINDKLPEAAAWVLDLSGPILSERLVPL